MVDLILFADNYWLVATDHMLLENMTAAWLSLLEEYGWEHLWKSSRGAHRRRSTASP